MTDNEFKTDLVEELHRLNSSLLSIVLSLRLINESISEDKANEDEE